MSVARWVSTSALAFTLAGVATGSAVPRAEPSSPGRDPFAMRRRGAPPAAPVPVPVPATDGLEGTSIDDIVVRGVLHAGGRSVAIVQGRGARHHLVRPGDRIRDGRVAAIDAAGLLIVADGGRAAQGPVRKALGAPREQR